MDEEEYNQSISAAVAYKIVMRQYAHMQALLGLFDITSPEVAERRKKEVTDTASAILDTSKKYRGAFCGKGLKIVGRFTEDLDRLENLCNGVLSKSGV